MGHILRAYSREGACLAATKNIINTILYYFSLDAAQYANCRYIRIIAFEAISMDLSPECDMNLKC